MPTSIEKISAGLSALEKGGLSNRTGLPIIVKDLGELATKATALGDKLAKINERLRGDFQKKQDEIATRFADMRSMGDGQVRPAEAMREVRKVLDEELSAHRKLVLANSATEREEALRELNGFRATVVAARDLFDSPVQMLTAANIGGERRARIFDEVRHLGGAALLNLAKRAAAEKDGELAAALVSVNDATASDRRSFSSVELAEVVMGSEHRKAAEFMGMVESTFTVALDADRELRSGKRDPMATLKRALQTADLDALHDDGGEKKPAPKPDAGADQRGYRPAPGYS